MPVNTQFLILSDTHFAQDNDPVFPKLPAVDVVLHCGDLTEHGHLQDYEKVLRLIGGINAELKLVIAGNHDITLDSVFCNEQARDTTEHDTAMTLWKGPLAREMGITYLEEGTHQFTLSNGAVFTVYASPYTPRFGESAFQYPTAEDRFNPPTETPAWATNVATACSIIPEFPAIDIVMSHGPPKYILDDCEDRSSAGCEHLRRAICRSRPRLHCFGHIHRGWGAQRVVWRKEAMNMDDDILDGVENNGDDDLVPLAPEFVGQNSSRKRGYATLNATSSSNVRHGRQTLMVNAAIMDDEGDHRNVPWLVELELPTAVAKFMVPLLAPALDIVLEETFAAASSLLPPSLRPFFVLVGGAALVRWGHRRKTFDIDIACSAEALIAFSLCAESDAFFSVASDCKDLQPQPMHSIRFSRLNDNASVVSITYTATSGITIPIDLLQIGDEAIPWLELAVSMEDGFYVASLSDLFVMKARAWVSGRDKEDKDRADFEWIVRALRARRIDYNPLLLLQLCT